MFCSQCGNKIGDKDKFCCHCGTPLSAATPPLDKLKRKATPPLDKLKTKGLPIDEPKAAGDEGYDVMISYCWTPEASKQTAMRLRDKLKEKQLRVWMDIDEMYGDINTRMVEGVTKSKVVVVVLSKGYQESPNCKREYEFATKRKKPIVPVKVDGHRLGDWLEFLAGNIVYHDVRSDKLMEQNLPAIMRDIEKYLGRQPDVPWDEEPPTPLPKESGKITDKDITDILDALGPDELTDLFFELDLTDRQIQTAERSVNSANVKQKSRNVLMLWRRQNSVIATREHALSALEKCRNIEAKEELAKKWNL